MLGFDSDGFCAGVMGNEEEAVGLVTCLIIVRWWLAIGHH